MKYRFRGEVKEGKLKVYDRHTMAEQVKYLDGQEVLITVEKFRRNRSLSQNSYYWLVVVPMVCEGMVDVGYRMSKESTHEFLKAKFLINELVNEETGEILKLPKSTTELTTVEFQNYIDEIQQWSAEYLMVYIPQPNEQMEIHEDYDY